MQDKLKTKHIVMMLVVVILLEIVCVAGFLMVMSSSEEPAAADGASSNRITYEHWMQEPKPQSSGTAETQSGSLLPKEVNFADQYNP